MGESRYTAQEDRYNLKDINVAPNSKICCSKFKNKRLYEKINSEWATGLNHMIVIAEK